MPPGRVSVTPDKAPPEHRYDVVVVGAGLLGTAVSALLRRWAPAASLLLVEADGIPNDGGATVASPGLVPPAGAPALEAASRWVLDWFEEEGISGQVGSAGWLELGASTGDGPPTSPLATVMGDAGAAGLATVLGVDRAHPARLLAGGYLSTEEAGLALARSAVRAGADLALNARAVPRDGRRLVLERLALDRRMQLGVHGRHEIDADVVVVACGAAAGDVAEAGLARPVRVPASYQQFPRLRWAPDRDDAPSLRRPVIEVAGWAIRPVAGGALLVPPLGSPDPVGYQPAGGRLLGVPVGLRRELLERLLDEPRLSGLVGSGRLDLGKSVRAVRGGMFSVTDDGRPIARLLGDGWWLLAGGSVSVLDDVAAAAQIAAAVAGVPQPW